MQLRGLVSTSANSGVASEWRETGPMLEIRTSRGLLIRSLSMHPRELEILLPHDAKYRVVSVRDVVLDNVKRRLFQLELYAD